MSQLITGITRNPSPTARRPASDSPWLWLALVGGSIAAHAVLAIIVLPSISRLSVQTQPDAQASYTSIDFVELPDPATAPTPAKSIAQPKTKSIGKPAATAAAASAPQTPSQPLPASATPTQASISVVPSPVALPATRLAPEPPQAAAPVPERSTAASPDPEPSIAASPVPAPAPAEAPSAEPPTPLRSVPAPPMAAAIPDRPSPTPSESPSLVTESIAVPIPDVSATLAPSETSPSPLPHLVISAAIASPRLSASLKLDRLPTPPGEMEPEVMATPKHGVMAQTFANPAAFPCLPLVTPEATQFWGETVAVQVTTDAAGQVTGTQVQQSSDNPAYDNLAQCIVEHWEFEPARVNDQPVPDHSLLVRVTLNQG